MDSILILYMRSNYETRKSPLNFAVPGLGSLYFISVMLVKKVLHLLITISRKCHGMFLWLTTFNLIARDPSKVRAT